MRAVTLLLAALAVLANASTALAHASLIGSEPPDRAVVGEAPHELKLTFNEPVSQLVLRLVRPAGEIVELKGALTADGATIVLPLPADLSHGTHLLSWRVMSSDGHPVGGALTFSIGQPSDGPTLPASADSRLHVAIWVVRLALYLGLFVGVGSAFAATWITLSAPSDWPRTVANRVLEMGLIAAILSVGLHGADALGLALADIRELRVWGYGLTSAYGKSLCIATVSLVLGLAALAARDSRARWCSALALAGVGAALAVSGHAATAGPELVTRPAVFLHAVSVAFWLGALLPLAATLSAGHNRVGLARFSKIIPWPFLLLIVSGVLLAAIQVRTVVTLWTTSYGVILACKLGAVCVLLALAAINRWLTPRVIEDDTRATQRLRSSIMAELAIMTVILGLVASWRFTPPPRALLLAAAQPIQVHIHTDRTMADIHIENKRDNNRRIRFTLLDGRFAPLTAKEVVLVLSKPDAGIEPLRRDAEHVDGTTWQVDDVRLPIAGRWRLEIEVLISDFEKITLSDDVEVAK
jgi:copper transport protein